MIEAEGFVADTAVNPRLKNYDIEISGDFDIEPTNVQVDSNGNLNDLDGKLNWQGGLVRYILSGLLNEVVLPPLTATFRTSSAGIPEAYITEQGSDATLIQAALDENGFVKVGMTKRFTTLLRNPWPGNDPPEKIILEVEEKLF